VIDERMPDGHGPAREPVCERRLIEKEEGLPIALLGGSNLLQTHATKLSNTRRATAGVLRRERGYA
jgi:hypothetical protein